MIPSLPYLTEGLSEEHKALIINSFESLYLLSKGMETFVKVGDVHYKWYRTKSISTEEAKKEFDKLQKCNLRNM